MTTRRHLHFARASTAPGRGRDRLPPPLPFPFARASTALGLASLLLCLALLGCRGESEPASTAADRTFLAGVARQELDLPVGLPQSGYGARYAKIPLLALVLGGGGTRLPDDRVSPYADGFFPTIGMLTRPNAKCLALELSEGGSTRRLVLCRVELAFVTDYLRRRVVDIVQTRTGLDLSQELILSATHTHSAGARFWRLPYFSDLGADTFLPEAFERIAWSIARNVEAALAAREPARLGVGILSGFDPADTLYRDRRTENSSLDLLDNEVPWRVDEAGALAPDGIPDGKVKDGQLTLLRVDRADGSPLALLFHFPVHGTTFEPNNLFMSSDTPGAIENQVELSFATPVLAMHVQGTAGDMEPTLVHGHPQLLLEEQGRIAAGTILELHRNTRTEAGLDGFESRSRDIRQDFELLGYPDAPAPYSAFDGPCGAAQCGLVYPDQPYYCLSRPTHHLPPYFFSPPLGDLISFFLCQWFEACTDDWAVDVITGMNPAGPPYEQPPELFHTQHSASLLRGVCRSVFSGEGELVRQGPADILLLGMPGEPTTPFGFELKGAIGRDLAAAGLRAGPEEVLVWGYTQDYFGYLLTPEDWNVGGYEISINLWGPLWGRHVARATRELATDLILGRRPAAETSPQYPPLALETIRPLTSGPAEVVSEPGDLALFSAGRLTWRGGDPGVDRPRVTLERQRPDGGFDAVLKPNGLPYDDAGPEIAVVYEDDQSWTAVWEAPWDFLAGTYRFLVEGEIYTGGDPRPEPPFYPSRTYRLTSRAFRVSPAGPLPLRNLRWTPGHLRGTPAYPTALYDADPNTLDGLRWRPACPQNLSGTVRFYLGPAPTGDPVRVEEHTVQADEHCRFDLRIDPSFGPRAHSLTVSLQDPAGTEFQAALP